MLPQGQSFEEVRDNFRWDVPEYFNMGVVVCDKWAEIDPQKTALIYLDSQNQKQIFSFADLKRLSNQLANFLVDQGIKPGDRVGILLPQTPETAYAHIAIHKLGGISIPLFTLFGTEALEYRLSNSGARAIITNKEGAAKIASIRHRLPDLQLIWEIEDPAPILAQSPEFTPLNTRADDPCLIIYTSGTTGQPKGALHAHRVLLGHLPGVEISHDLFPQAGDVIWTPADWAWIGGLLDVLMPALYHGIPVVAKRFEKFSPEAAFQLIEDLGVRNAFLPPTALKLMRSVPDPEKRWKLNMRTIASGGETLGAELIDWGRKVFGLTINEFYGQTECNMIVSSVAALMPARPGIMGRPVPGHQLAIVDAKGVVLPNGVMGNIAVKSPDPVMFLEYWGNPKATQAKFVGDWLLTGDSGIEDDMGWIKFVGRDDDVITSAGYRIGPGEIEDCIMGHKAVRMVGVVGKPDALRTEIVKAFIVLKDGFAGSEELAQEIQEWVKERLAAHEYPREVEFIDSLPLTTTGKIIRRELRDR